MMKNLAFLLCLLIGPSISRSQQDPCWQRFHNGTYVLDIVNDGESLWVSCANGIGKVDKSTGALLELYNPDQSDFPAYDQTRHIAAGPNGEIWASVYGIGVAVLSNGTWFLYDESNSPLTGNGVIGPQVLDIMVASDGKVYIGTSGNGLYIKDGPTWTNFTTANSPLPHDRISVIKEDQAGTIWIGTGQFYNDFGGLAKLTASSDWEVFTMANTDLPANGIGDIAIDNDQNIWIATKSGLTRFDGSTWTTWQEDEYVFSLDIDQDQNIYLGMSKSIKIFDGIDTWKDIPAPTVTTYNHQVARILADPDSSFWVVTYGGTGLFQYRDLAWKEITPLGSGLTSTPIYSITKSSDDHYWMGSSYWGLVEYDGASWTTHDQLYSPLPDWRILELEETNGQLLLGKQWGSHGMITRFDGQTETTLMEETGQFFDFEPCGDSLLVTIAKGILVYDSTTDSLVPFPFSAPSTHLTGLELHNDAIWVTSWDRGLHKLTNGQWQSWDTLNSSIPNNDTRMLQLDHFGNPWFISKDTASEFLLIKFDGNAFIDFTDTSLIQNISKINSFSVIDDHHIYIAHDKGISIKENGIWTWYKSDRMLTVFRDNNRILFGGSPGVFIYDPDCGNTSIVPERADQPVATLVPYPNPASVPQRVFVNSPGMPGEWFSLYSSAGHLVLQVTASSTGTTPLDCSSLLPGIYFIYLQDQTGIQAVGKLIIP
ncbi:MAG: two-component regulator propeller domain-containing protein [Saprospiraceae bacterium]